MAGDLRITRRYYVCRACKHSATPWDAWAGVGDDHLTPQTRRMAVLAGSSWSFDVAETRLRQLCELRISADVIRKVTNAAGRRAQTWQTESAAAGAAFRGAAGGNEFSTDGTSVNTREGWREIRLGVFARREPGPPAAAAEWTTRELPKPTARVAFAGLCSAEEFGRKWTPQARRLGLDPQRDAIDVLGDGARWIWNQTALHLPRGESVLDIFHVSEHFHACGKVLHGESNPTARTWADTKVLALIEQGPMNTLAKLAQEKSALRGGSKAAAARRRALTSLIDYLTPNVERMRYRQRLEKGLPIGSGLIEGACKTIVGRRLKPNSARWHANRAERVASLCCLLYNHQWETFWQTQAA